MKEKWLGNYEICHLDETFEARIVLDVEAVEGDATGPRESLGFEKVLNLVIVDVQGENRVRGFGHEFLAEVRAYEPTGTDHADRERLDGFSVQIHSRHCAVSVFVHTPNNASSNSW